MEWPLLACLTPQDRAAVVAGARRRRFARGEVLFHEGDAADSLHVIESGHVLVQVTTEAGERSTINVLGVGATLGELSLAGTLVAPGERSATALALDDCETRVLSVSTFASLCEQHPAIRTLLVELLAQRVRELSQRLLEAYRVGLDRRVYRRLVELSEIFGGEASAAGPVTLPVTQEQLADMAGGTRPSVNQVLQRLVAQGVIELGRGRVVVHQPALLARKAGA